METHPSNMEIVVSYSRKINHDLYGGQPYESSDHFCSLKLVIDEETNPKTAHEELAQTAKEMVDARVEAEIMDMHGGMSKKNFNEWLCGALQGKWGTVEDYNKMSPYQQNIAQVLKKAYKRIKYQKEHASNFDSDQAYTENIPEDR